MKMEDIKETVVIFSVLAVLLAWLALTTILIKDYGVFLGSFTFLIGMGLYLVTVTKMK